MPDASVIDLGPIDPDGTYTVMTVVRPCRLACFGYRGFGPGVYRIPGHFVEHKRHVHDLRMLQAGIFSLEVHEKQGAAPAAAHDTTPREIAPPQYRVYGDEPRTVVDVVIPEPMAETVTVAVTDLDRHAEQPAPAEVVAEAQSEAPSAAPQRRQRRRKL